MAALADASGSAPLSEFMRINAALICLSVRDPDGPSLTYLVVPVVGPTPLLLGFFAALGNINEQRKSGQSRLPFVEGQRVKIDQDAVRIFDGFTEDGLSFRFIKERTERGQVLRTVEQLPLSQLYRLVPEEHGKKTVGTVTRSANEKLGPLDWLFTSEQSVFGLGHREQVVVVASLGETRELAQTISICGRPLVDALPFAHRKADGAWERWSSRFGVARPQLVVVADADHAYEFVEGEESMPTLVIIDATGRNAGRAASTVCAIGGSPDP